MSAVSVTPRSSWIRIVTSRAQVEHPTLIDWVAALASSILLILSFPNFELSFLAWVGLVPLMVAIARRPTPIRALILGWTTGTIFFYVSCYWLTYSIINYGELPVVVAYLLLVPGAIVVGLFPGLFALTLAVVIRRWGLKALLLSPLIWIAFEYLRLGITGQLWNALGYSQAYHPALIQTARWGGVYAVGFLVVSGNASVAWALLQRTIRGFAVPIVTLVVILIISYVSYTTAQSTTVSDSVEVIAIQPNVPMTLIKSPNEFEQLTARHLQMTAEKLSNSQSRLLPTLVIWPESPMNFTYSTDRRFQELVRSYALQHHISILFNSQEPAPAGGIYNSAVLINEEGRVISQYDKIRLLPFGEYVPLPRWLPGASLITGIVGDFTPGANYTLMPIADQRAGVFICIESAYPSIARTMTNGGADVLINISNDGYLGPTAVMRQHLANAVFRAVENDRSVVRVTNSGITALIEPNGVISDQTKGFEIDSRVWRLQKRVTQTTFYTRYGDILSMFAVVITTLAGVSAFWLGKELKNSR